MKEKDIELLEVEKKDQNIELSLFEDEEDEKREEILEEEDKDKVRLINVLDRLKNKLDQKDKKKIVDVYLTNEDFEKQLMKDKEKRNVILSKRSKCCYKFSLFLFTSIFLTGSFIIASLKKSSWNIFFTSLKCFIDISCDKDDFIKQANFYHYFLEQLLREPVDLNLIMFWNLIGESLLKSIGFRITAIIFLVFNSTILTIIYNISYDNYNKEAFTYSFLKIIALFFIWFAMAVFFGASTLLAQRKFIDFYSLFDYQATEEEIEASYKKLESELVIINNTNDIYDNNNEKVEGLINSKDEDDIINIELIKDQDVKVLDAKEQIKKIKEKMRKKNFDSFLLFSLANILGYMGKYGIGIGFKYYQQNNIFVNNETVFNNTIDKNIINITNYFYSNNSTDTPITNKTEINF